MLLHKNVEHILKYYNEYVCTKCGYVGENNVKLVEHIIALNHVQRFPLKNKTSNKNLAFRVHNNILLQKNLFKKNDSKLLVCVCFWKNSQSLVSDHSSYRNNFLHIFSKTTQWLCFGKTGVHKLESSIVCLLEFFNLPSIYW